MTSQDKMVDLLSRMMALKPADQTRPEPISYLLPREMMDEASELLAEAGK